jgi:hypothetical protein
MIQKQVLSGDTPLDLEECRVALHVSSPGTTAIAIPKRTPQTRCRVPEEMKHWFWGKVGAHAGAALTSDAQRFAGSHGRQSARSGGLNKPASVVVSETECKTIRDLLARSLDVGEYN